MLFLFRPLYFQFSMLADGPPDGSIPRPGTLFLLFLRLFANARIGWRFVIRRPFRLCYISPDHADSFLFDNCYKVF